MSKRSAFNPVENIEIILKKEKRSIAVEILDCIIRRRGMDTMDKAFKNADPVLIILIQVKLF